MSTLFVEPVVIREVKPHPNAERLELAMVKGWQNVVGKGTFKEGDVVIHVPPDAMVPRPLAEEWGVAPYLAWKKTEEKGRVRAARLRQEMSYGFLVPNDMGAEIGTNLAEHFGITKWEPPPIVGDGDQDHPHPLFHKYTDVENLQNFPDLFEPGEEVVATEKIHGRNNRVGIVRHVEGGDTYDRPVLTLGDGHEYLVMVGSHSHPRKCGQESIYEWGWREKRRQFEVLFGRIVQSWESEKGVLPQSVVVFGELYGYKMQDLAYGMGKKLGFATFDIAVDHGWLDHDEVVSLVEHADLEMAPILYRGPYDADKLGELADGDTTLGGGPHMREGLVVRPVKERRDPDHGRVILKLKGAAYVMRKGGTEYQ